MIARTNLLTSLAHFSVSCPSSITSVSISGHHSGTLACGSLLLTSFAGSRTRLAGVVVVDGRATTTSFPPKLRSLFVTTAPLSGLSHQPRHHSWRREACETSPSNAHAAAERARDHRRAEARKRSEERRKVRTTRSLLTTRTEERRSL